jgi:hypothetical protein
LIGNNKHKLPYSQLDYTTSLWILSRCLMLL